MDRSENYIKDGYDLLQDLNAHLITGGRYITCQNDKAICEKYQPKYQLPNPVEIDAISQAFQAAIDDNYDAMPPERTKDKSPIDEAYDAIEEMADQPKKKKRKLIAKKTKKSGDNEKTYC